MGKTLTHGITYPDGGGVPNVPVAMQAMAESVDRAIAGVSEAPFIVCHKVAPQTAKGGKDTAVTWDKEVWNQGIGRVPDDASQFIIQEDGLYSANARLAFAAGNQAAGTGVAGVVMNVNGVNRPETFIDQATPVGVGPKPTTLTDQKLYAGDVVRILATWIHTDTRLIPAECVFSLRKSAGFSSAGQGSK